jgi:hypothetical protein
VSQLRRFTLALVLARSAIDVLAWIQELAAVRPGEPLPLRWLRTLPEHPWRSALALALGTLAVLHRPSIDGARLAPDQEVDPGRALEHGAKRL